MQKQEIKTITLSLPLKMGTVNCYLVETGSGFVLIDTGGANRRTELENALASAGCKPGDLKLIVLTHGDFDHTGNAAYLREKFGAKIAMHRDDAGMAEQGNMFWNRSSGNALIRLLAPVLFRFPKSNRFTPDLTLEEGDDLAAYGFDAQIVSIPGHSKGSIGILAAAPSTGSGQAPSAGSGQVLFCGDLLENTKEPAAGSIMDNAAACAASLEKLRGFEIHTVYPGHGVPFPLASFFTGQQLVDCKPV
jgi:hydroxyacylglutathione hydrolase